jgi:two-component system, OmpR family, sensor histidine kinase KdpD
MTFRLAGMQKDASRLKQEESRSRNWWDGVLARLCLAFAGVVGMTALIYWLHLDVSFASVSMLYFLVVTLAAIWLGRLAAVLTCLLSFLSFNWFFFEPRYHLTVQNPNEWLTLCMFLITATVTGQLTAMLKTRAEEAYRSQKEAKALADATWAIASELNLDRALTVVLHQLASVAQVESAAILGLDPTDPEAAPEIIAQYNYLSKPGLTVAQLQESVGGARPADWQQRPLYLPINVEEKLLAVLLLDGGLQPQILPGQKRIIDSLVNQAALVLQREKLMKARAMAQALIEADHLKTALLRMVSHDFRSPLTAIKASVGSLLQEDKPGAELALLETVDQEADRLNSMVGNILDLSRLEAGAWQPRREITPVAEVIGAALDSFSKEDNQRIQVVLARDLPDLFVDSVQITQVLTNLLDNALKYAPENPVELRAFAENQELSIEVMDRGMGLPLDESDSIFEPFFRAPELKEGPLPGLGIGLAICRGLVTAHGGRLSAFNRAGGGAVFRVTLPDNSAGETKGPAVT